MKKTVELLSFLVLVFILSGCSRNQDSITFVKDNVTPGNLQCADFKVNIGKKVRGAKIIAELWQNGVCTESTPVIINDETKEIHIMISVDGFGTTKGVQGINTQIDTNKLGSALAYFELPTQVLGYSFTAYNENEVIEINPDTEVILAAMGFDTGAGVRTLDCRNLEDNPDYLSSYSCLLIIRSSFTAE